MKLMGCLTGVVWYHWLVAYSLHEHLCRLERTGLITHHTRPPGPAAPSAVPAAPAAAAAAAAAGATATATAKTPWPQHAQPTQPAHHCRCTRARLLDGARVAGGSAVLPLFRVVPPDYQAAGLETGLQTDHDGSWLEHADPNSYWSEEALPRIAPILSVRAGPREEAYPALTPPTSPVLAPPPTPARASSPSPADPSSASDPVEGALRADQLSVV